MFPINPTYLTDAIATAAQAAGIPEVETTNASRWTWSIEERS